MDLTLPQLQAQMRAGYGSGWTGIAASALAWAVAAGVAWQGSAQHAITALLAGGVLIFPASLVLGKLLHLPCHHPKGNALGSLAGASTFWLIFCLPIAWLLGQQQPAWFFAAMLLVIGGRYLVFASVYGLTALSMPAAVIATTGAIVELAFAIVCARQHYRRP